MKTDFVPGTENSRHTRLRRLARRYIHDQNGAKRFLLTLLVALITVKLLLLVIDSKPQLFVGDSCIYLATALTGYIPLDRSFSYGYVLRALAVWPHSLRTVVWAQTAMSTAACWLVAVCLIRYFGSGVGIAALCSLACAIEPLQLLSERYILTEALANVLFAVFVFTCFEYLCAGTLFSLGAVQFIGVLLVSIRVSFLPIVLFCSVALPLMRPELITFVSEAVRQRRPRILITTLSQYAVIPLLCGLCLSQLLLFGYRHLYAYILHPGLEPGYLYHDGFFLAGDFAPIIIPADYPIPEQRAAIFGSLKFPLKDRRVRDQQRWAEGGLCDRIVEQFHNDHFRANPVARATALRAFKRAPFGVVRLAAGTFADYFDRSYLIATLEVDEAMDRQLDGMWRPLVWEYKREFGEDFSNLQIDSPTKRWHRRVYGWYWLLLMLPAVLWCYLVVRWRTSNRYSWLCAFLLPVFLEGAVGPVTRPTARYMTSQSCPN